MKTMTKHLLATALLAASTSASAELSVNLGAMSDYYFRGIDQTADNGSLTAGADYNFGNGFAIGTWAAQLDGSEFEYDLYGSYSAEAQGFSYDLGYAGYFYSEDGATDFHEVIFNGGYGPISAQYVLGTEDASHGDEADYSFFSLTGEYKGAYLTYGSFGKDYDGDYAEAGYGLSVQGVDLSLAYVHQLDDLSGDGKKDKELILTLSKTFDL
ncbi:TorF family putative porin [Marinobacterium weihaiense]|uniref:TorF family putative porin n=1 Tax=Marinobacterium weihaiense TaxID=2851016 RepID=A0ABS6MDZ3_9GAMM|nr:TorF family putative porin [Marinobacterium weihaiense]MBV0934493.1 TorF family putative porin [Marinobacterium weihaiense]